MRGLAAHATSDQRLAWATSPQTLRALDRLASINAEGVDSTFLVNSWVEQNIHGTVHISQGDKYPTHVRTQDDRVHTIVITVPGAGNTHLVSVVLQMHDGQYLVLPIYGQYDARGHPHYIGVATPGGRASGKRKLDNLNEARIKFDSNDSAAHDYIAIRPTEEGDLEIKIKVFTNITSGAHGGGHFGWRAEGKLATDQGQNIEFTASTNDWYKYGAGNPTGGPKNRPQLHTTPETDFNALTGLNQVVTSPASVHNQVATSQPWDGAPCSGVPMDVGSDEVDALFNELLNGDFDDLLDLFDQDF